MTQNALVTSVTDESDWHWPGSDEQLIDQLHDLSDGTYMHIDGDDLGGRPTQTFRLTEFGANPPVLGEGDEGNVTFHIRFQSDNPGWFDLRVELWQGDPGSEGGFLVGATTEWLGSIAGESNDFFEWEPSFAPEDLTDWNDLYVRVEAEQD